MNHAVAVVAVAYCSFAVVGVVEVVLGWNAEIGLAWVAAAVAVAEAGCYSLNCEKRSLDPDYFPALPFHFERISKSHLDCHP